MSPSDTPTPPEDFTKPKASTAKKATAKKASGTARKPTPASGASRKRVPTTTPASTPSPSTLRQPPLYENPLARVAPGITSFDTEIDPGTAETVREPKRFEPPSLAQSNIRVSPRTTQNATHHSQNIPPSFPSAFSWFFHGLTRQTTGVTVALLSGYTALWISLWYAVLGLIFGALVALHAVHSNSFTHHLFNAGAGTSVTAVAVLTGALVGAGGGFVSFYTHTLVVDPLVVVGSILSGLVLAIVIVAVIAVFEGNLLALRGYRSVTVEEARRLSPLLQQLGTDFHLSDAPRFAINENPVSGAYTHMRHIVLTKGLLMNLDDSELTAVIGHELYHWQVGDSVGLHFVWACAWPVAILYDIASRISGRLAPQEQIPPTRATGIVAIIAWAIAWPAYVLIKFPITLAVRHDMRLHEFEADASVARLGYGPALVNALRILSMHSGARTGWEAALYSTHPSYDQRIDALRIRQNDDRDFVDPPLGTETNRFLDFALIPIIVFAALIALGAIINTDRAQQANASQPTASAATPFSSTTLPQSTFSNSEQQAVEKTTADYTVAFVDSVFDQPGYEQVFNEYASQQTASTLILDANGGNPYIDASWAAGKNVTSTAAAVACEFQPGATSNTATGNALLRWTYGANGSLSTIYLSEPISLTSVNNKWLVTSAPLIPDIPDDTAQGEAQSSTIPAGYGKCP